MEVIACFLEPMARVLWLPRPGRDHRAGAKRGRSGTGHRSRRKDHPLGFGVVRDGLFGASAAGLVQNLTAKIKKHAKIHVVDSGFAAWLRGQSADSLARPTAEGAGPIMEKRS